MAFESGTGKNRKDLFLEGEARRQAFMNHLRAGLTPQEALNKLNLTPSALRQWRKRDPKWSANLDGLLNGTRTFEEFEEDMKPSFDDFRLRYFGHRTPPHQQMMLQAMVGAKPGDIVMILVPPEHGKTTFFEDFACWKLAMDPNYRITVGTEAQALARRIIGRVKNRMELDGPFPEFVRKYGPFVPDRTLSRATRQVWAQDYFNVHKRKLSDQRDYSMVGIGFTSNIAGTRTDQLHGDDLQSMKTLNQTEKFMEMFRQDWLTRPGETGFTTINGTRVGDGDIYEAMMEEFGGEDLFRLVRLPAIIKDPETREDRPLWEYDPVTKSGYTLNMLERIQKKVGPDAWSRNYMQQPRAKGLGTFTEDIVDRCMNFERSLQHEVPVPGAPIYIGLDPALGGINCLMAIQVTGEKLYILDVMEDQALARNEQIMDRLDTMVRRMNNKGAQVSEVIVEAMNFQRGLARDERLKELGERHGFAIREHLTGANKYDVDIGVPSMVSTFIRGEIDIAHGDDDHTRTVANELRHQLLRWRPGIKGNFLRQDQVMALWFVWCVWQSRRKAVDYASDNFRSHGLPWKPLDSGLVIPAVRAASPFFRG